MREAILQICKTTCSSSWPVHDFSQAHPELVPELRLRGLSRCRLYFQQDGATCHTSNESTAQAKRVFPGKVISKRGDFDWPPCSPDLIAYDFFLWRYLKNKVYMHKRKSLHEIKNAIRQENHDIPWEMLE